MIELLVILTPIALIDSTSIVPLCIVLLLVLLSGPAPLIRSSMLLVGIFVTNMVCGLLILFGLGSLFEALEATAIRVWKHPNAEELIFQILLGLLLIAFARRMARSRGGGAGKKVDRGMTGTQAFTAGLGLTIVGMPGAVPYFGAINLILRDQLPVAQSLGALAFYNLVFLAPLIALVTLRLILGARAAKACSSASGPRSSAGAGGS